MIRIAAAISLTIVSTITLAQQSWPARPLRLVVPFPPGGATDIIGRSFGAKLSEQLGRPVVIENKSGAAGTIGTADAARASADGYTILIGEPGGMSIAASVQKGLSYDPARDFAPISQVVSVPMMLVAHPSLAARSLTDLIALAKSSNPPLQYASPGAGTVQHLTTEQLRIAAGIALAHIPYKGGPPALNDLLGGQVLLSMLTIPTVAPHLKSGKLVGLVLLARNRDPAYPGMQTTVEAGLSGFEEGIWQGFFAPAGTPREIVERLNAEIHKAARTQEVRERLEGLGARLVVGTPEAFAQLLREDIARWAKVVAQTNLN